MLAENPLFMKQFKNICHLQCQEETAHLFSQSTVISAVRFRVVLLFVIFQAEFLLVLQMLMNTDKQDLAQAENVRSE